MTARLVFEATLIELSKLQAPSLKLYEFNYLFNKAINQYINKVYNVYDINQQTTDDLRVLKSTAFLTPHKVELSHNNSAIRNNIINKDVIWYSSENTGEEIPETNLPKLVEKISEEVIKTKNDNVNKTVTKESFKGADENIYVKETTIESENSGRYSGLASSYLSDKHKSIQSLHGATYEVYMPIDYLHMLNCVCIYYVAKQKDCWDAGSYIEVPATRLTADSWSQIISDIYNRPSPMRPYYYIHNMNKQLNIPTDPIEKDKSEYPTGFSGTDMANYPYNVTSATGGEMGIGNDFDTNPAASTENSNFQRTFKLDIEGQPQVSLVEKPTAFRAGNTSNVRCEIRYGKNVNILIFS